VASARLSLLSSSFGEKPLNFPFAIGNTIRSFVLASDSVNWFEAPFKSTYAGIFRLVLNLLCVELDGGIRSEVGDNAFEAVLAFSLRGIGWLVASSLFQDQKAPASSGLRCVAAAQVRSNAPPIRFFYRKKWRHTHLSGPQAAGCGIRLIRRWPLFVGDSDVHTMMEDSPAQLLEDHYWSHNGQSF